MRVITKQRLSQVWQKHKDAEEPLKAWFKEAEHARWKTPNDIKARYRSADFLSNNRVVFNIKGNHYRVIVQIHYDRQIVYIRFAGTHQEYGRIDAETI